MGSARRAGPKLASALGLSASEAGLVSKAVEFRQLDDLLEGGLGMWASLWGPDTDAQEAALPEIPSTEGASAVAAWCADRLATADRTPAGLWAIGRAVGELRQVFANRGWAVVAAMFAVGDLAALMDYDALAPALGREVLRAWASDQLAELTASPRPERARGPAAGGSLVGAVLGAIAREISAQPAALRPVAAARMHHTLDVAASWQGASQLEMPAVLARSDGTRELLAMVGAVIEEPWTWEMFERWRSDDPLAAAKAVARVHGLGAWAAPFDDLQAELARHLETAWVEAATAALDALGGADPVILAIAALVDEAAAEMAALVGSDVRRRWAGDPVDLAARCAALVGDPRPQVALWSAAALPLVTVLAALDEVER